jgi:hypothetical protein
VINFPELPGTSLPHHLFHIVFSSPSSSPPPSPHHHQDHPFYPIPTRPILTLCRTPRHNLLLFLKPTHSRRQCRVHLSRKHTSSCFRHEAPTVLPPPISSTSSFVRSMAVLGLSRIYFSISARQSRSSIFFQLNPRDTPLGRTLWHDWKGD